MSGRPTLWTPSATRMLVRILLFSALAFVLVLAWQHRVESWRWLAGADWRWIAVALFFLGASTFGAALLFKSSLLATPANPSLRAVIGIFLLSQVGKYIPGKVWGLVLQRIACGGLLTTRDVVDANINLAVAALIVSAGGALGFALWVSDGLFPALVAILTTTLVIGVLSTTNAVSRLLQILISRVPRRLRCRYARHREERFSGGRESQLKTGWAGAALFATGYSAGWLALIVAGADTNLDGALMLAAALSASYLVGLVSMLPAGIGAREAALVALGASLQLPVEETVPLAVMARLATVALDLLSAGAGAVLLRQQGVQT